MIGSPTTEVNFPSKSPSFPGEKQEVETVSALLGTVGGILQRHKAQALGGATTFHALDMRMAQPAWMEQLAQTLHTQGVVTPGGLRVSGFHPEERVVTAAGERLASNGFEASLHSLDVHTTEGLKLRNRLGGWADLAVYAHAAYPHQLPEFKLPRMVSRLGDMLAQHGAAVTIHHAGGSDVDHICKDILHLPVASKAGLRCQTEQMIEQSFGASKLHAFSITVPNFVQIPNDPEAFEAVFHQLEPAQLTETTRQHAAQVWNVLAEMAGGHEVLQEAIESMGESARTIAVQHLVERGKAEPNQPLTLSLDSAQVVMAFRNLEVAREAFAQVQQMGEAMSPPCLALPISRTIAPETDKQKMHDDWCARLESDHGVSHLPTVCQIQTAQTGRQR